VIVNKSIKLHYWLHLKFVRVGKLCESVCIACSKVSNVITQIYHQLIYVGQTINIPIICNTATEDKTGWHN
jgi:hypothetical protein